LIASQLTGVVPGISHWDALFLSGAREYKGMTHENKPDPYEQHLKGIENT